MIRRGDAVSIESPDLPGLLVRCRRPTLMEAHRLASARMNPPLDPEGIVGLSVFLDGLGFVVEDGGRTVSARDFLVGADIWTVQAVMFSVLVGSAFDPTEKKAAAPEPISTVDPE